MNQIKIRITLAILTILLCTIISTITIVPLPIAYCVSTTVANNGIVASQSHSMQGKTFNCSNRFWVFYCDGSNFFFKSSPDGSTWSAAKKYLSSTQDRGYELDILFDGTYCHIAVANYTSSGGIYYQKGTPNSDGTITWGTQYAAVGVDSGKTKSYLTICVDTNGYPWIAYSYYVSSYTVYVVKATATDGSTWGSVVQLDSTAGTVLPRIQPLSGGNMYCLWAYYIPAEGSRTLRGKYYTYSTSSWDISYTTIEANVKDYDRWSAVSLANDSIALAYINGTSNYVCQRIYDHTNGWSALYTISTTNVDTYSSATIAKNSNNVYIFWSYETGGNIYEIHYVSPTWSSAITFVSADTNLQARYITCDRIVSTSYFLGVSWMTGTGPSYNIRFGWLDTTPANAVNLNTPSSGDYIYSRIVTFSFTPAFYQPIINASLYLNTTNTNWGFAQLNTTAVSNNVPNSITYTLPAISASGYPLIVWNIQIWNSTNGIFSAVNYTFYLHDNSRPTFSPMTSNSTGQELEFIIGANDGYGYTMYENSYEDARSAVSANITRYSGTTSYYRYLWVGQGYTSLYTPPWDVYRSYLYFDTTALTGTIDNAYITFWGYSDQHLGDSSTPTGLLGSNFTITVTNGQPSYPNNPPVDSDYDMIHYSGAGGGLDTTKFVVCGMNVLQLNSTGIGWINKGGMTKFCLRSDRDINDITPTYTEFVKITSYDGASVANNMSIAPRLVVNVWNSSDIIGTDTNTYTFSCYWNDNWNMSKVYAVTNSTGTVVQTDITPTSWYNDTSFLATYSINNLVSGDFVNFYMYGVDMNTATNQTEVKLFSQRSRQWYSIPWIFYLNSMQWNSVIWSFGLKTMQWYSIPFTFWLQTMQWNSVPWIFYLQTSQWNTIPWSFILQTSKWYSIPWSFILDTTIITQGWIAQAIVVFGIIGVAGFIFFSIKRKKGGGI